MIRPERLEQLQSRLPDYFLLDGQQRLTSLATAFLERHALRDLLAEVEEEMPYLFGNLRHFPAEIDALPDGGGKKFPWVSLDRLLNGSIKDDPDYRNHLTDNQRASVDKFTQRIREYQFPVQTVRGRKYEDVAEIFVSVNSAGTQLPGAEISFARIVPYWSGITKEFRQYRHNLRQRDYDLDLTFLLRAITAIECGVAKFHRLADAVPRRAEEEGRSASKKRLDKTWRMAKQATDSIIRLLRRELQMDKSKFFTSKNVLVPLVYYRAIEKCKASATKNVLRFFLLSQLSEHYSKAGETALGKDLRSLSEYGTPRQGLDALVKTVAAEARPYFRGLKVKPSQVCGAPTKNALLLLMYIIMRDRDATDIGVERPRKISDLCSNEIQLHHIFPFNFMMTDMEARRLAEGGGYTPSEFRALVNDIANLTFTGRGNPCISDRPPSEYLANETTEAVRKAHCIPENPELWRTENFEKFLAERRKQLASAMNALLKPLFPPK